MKPEFPNVQWGDKRVSFTPHSGAWLPGLHYSAALVFAFAELSPGTGAGRKIVLADIVGRGWCIPSGGIEQGETPEAAAQRECLEEAGLVPGPLTVLGTTRILSADGASEIAAAHFGARAARFEPIPEGFESRGIRLAGLDELPRCYFHWDELMAALFAYAWEQVGTLTE